MPKVRFKDITTAAGIDFHHTNGAFGKRLLPETFGSGVAFLDYDNDGRQDILFINSCNWPGHEGSAKSAPTLKLYRNRGDGTFENVTEQAGLNLTLYGLGVTAGDFDNDGYIDLFITALGGCRLLRNVAGPDGKRKFVDVTKEAGGFTARGTWPATGDLLERDEPVAFPSSAAFFDYDQDGLLDIFVCNYVKWSPKIDLAKQFKLKDGSPAYGLPQVFDGTQCQLFRNLGNGKFRDVSAEVGIEVTDRKTGKPVGKALGVAICDVDGDGWPDIVVANDTVRNFFFRNQRNGKFVEQGEQVGVATADGTPRGGMGIDCGEYLPGKYGIYIGNFADEPDSLFRLEHSKRLVFADVAAAEGLGGPSRLSLTFGVFFFDYDLDGRLDVLCCNGHLEPDIAKVKSGESYAQAPQLFWNSGGQRAFAMIGESEAGADLFRPLVGRGCAFGDIDGDGYPDVVLTANGGPARLLRNEGGNGHHWLRLVLQGDGQRVNRSAIGATVALYVGGKVLHRHVGSARGYLSQSELPITFGLGDSDHFDKIEIHWPGKDVPPQVVTGLQVDHTHVIQLKGG